MNVLFLLIGILIGSVTTILVLFLFSAFTLNKRSEDDKK